MKSSISNFRSEVSDWWAGARAVVVVVATLGSLPALSGCASRGPRFTEGPRELAAVERHPWAFRGEHGTLLRTPDGQVFTTVAEDDELFGQLPQLVQGAIGVYRSLAPTAGVGVHASDGADSSAGAGATARVAGAPLTGYVFAYRSQWEAFTTAFTREAAPEYLGIRRAGYAVGDTFVAYDLGDHLTPGTVAHEGWHAFSGRHFRSPLPAFVEEGVATLFEHVEFDGRLPRWNLSVNPRRARALRAAVERGKLLHLPALLATHAGQVVAAGDDLDVFYAQAWALARFLREGDGHAHRPSFDRMIAGAVAGDLRTAAGPVDTRTWTAQAAHGSAILEHYLALPIDEIDRRYRAFCRRVAINGVVADDDE